MHTNLLGIPVLARTFLPPQGDSAWVVDNQPTHQANLVELYVFFLDFRDGREPHGIVCFVQLVGGTPPTIAPWIVCFVRLAGGRLGGVRRRLYVFHTNLLRISIVPHIFH